MEGTVEKITVRLQELSNIIGNGKYSVLARKAGIPTSTMQGYVSGNMGKLPYHLYNLSLRLNVNLNWLITGDGNMFIDHMEDDHITIGSNIINGESNIKATQSINSPDQVLIEHVVPVEKKLLLMDKLEEKKAQGLMTEAQYQKAMDELWGVESGTAPPLSSG